MVIITPALLAPVNLITLDSRMVGFTRWLVAILAASVVDIAIVFVAFADGSLLPQEQRLREIPPNSAVVPEPRPKRKMSRKHITDAEILAMVQSNPGISNSAIARQFGVTRQAISERRKHLTV